MKLADTNKEEELVSLAARQWLAQGKAEGRAGGSLAARRRPWSASFPESLDQRIAQADLQQLDRWFDAALDATALDQVFSPEH